MQLKDYIIYIDTDSLFVNLYDFFKAQGISDKFNALSEDEKVEFIRKVASIVQDHVNKESFEKTQLLAYNSQETNNKVSFKSELICSAGMFLKKKKYMVYCIFEDGYRPASPLKVTGLDVIKSDCPSIVKPLIKNIMIKILTSNDKEELISIIKEYKKDIELSTAEQIASNIAVHDLNKYIDSEFVCKKGTPRHTKGVAAYKLVMRHLGIENKADNIESGDKCKVVYLKSNKFNIDTISFITWPEEFNEVFQLDFAKMIDKSFLQKLKPMFDILNIDIENDIKDDMLNEWFDF